MKPNISIKDNCSLRNIQAITAEVAGIKKNTVTVLLAELFLIKNINIVNAPKDTRNDMCLAAMMNYVVIPIYALTK